jgi:threonine aldolase
MDLIDLRSDTVTLPTLAMRDAMRDAQVGDDSRDGDPTVRRLEALAARRTGKEAALFVASGTMGNLVALLAHAQRGGGALLEANAHMLESEMGGITALAGLFPHRSPGVRGAMDVRALEAAIRDRISPGAMPTAVICMETTHNHAGGTVLPLDHMASVHALGRASGIPVHTDGARLFNAAVALGVDASRIAAHTDSVSFCLSKGLSAPIGSMLCGSAAFVERARAFRRMAGGNMRQAGIIAAAGIVALEEMVERLADDHARARELGVALHALDAQLVDLATVQTNIVRVNLEAARHPAAWWSAALARRGVSVAPAGARALRFVTHRHIGTADIERAVDAFTGVWREAALRSKA